MQLYKHVYKHEVQDLNLEKRYCLNMILYQFTLCWSALTCILTIRIHCNYTTSNYIFSSLNVIVWRNVVQQNTIQWNTCLGIFSNKNSTKNRGPFFVWTLYRERANNWAGLTVSEHWWMASCHVNCPLLNKLLHTMTFLYPTLFSSPWAPFTSYTMILYKTFL